MVTGALTLLVITIVTFGIYFVTPKVLGTDPALLYIGRINTPEALEGTRHKLGLDQPIHVQYLTFIKGVVAGRDFNAGPETTHCPAPCFGYSFKTDQEVWPLLTDRLPVTFSLAIGAAIIWLVSGVLAGVISALRRRSIIDRTVMIIALAGISLPIYFTGLLAQAIFVYKLQWLPSVNYVNFATDPFRWAQALLLPWITLALLFAATYARLTRATMLETLGEDYVRTARAKGLRERTVIGKHAMRAVMTPVVTVFGLDLGGLLGGAILTETVFSLPGLGKLAIDAIGQQDLPIILGVTMFAAFFIVLANIVVDVLYGVIDPRVRLK
jgi:peptide/nickel transport system permease protein